MISSNGVKTCFASVTSWVDENTICSHIMSEVHQFGMLTHINYQCVPDLIDGFFTSADFDPQTPIFHLLDSTRNISCSKGGARGNRSTLLLSHRLCAGVSSIYVESRRWCARKIFAASSS